MGYDDQRIIRKRSCEILCLIPWCRHSASASSSGQQQHRYGIAVNWLIRLFASVVPRVSVKGSETASRPGECRDLCGRRI